MAINFIEQQFEINGRKVKERGTGKLFNFGTDTEQESFFRRQEERQLIQGGFLNKEGTAIDLTKSGVLDFIKSRGLSRIQGGQISGETRFVLPGGGLNTGKIGEFDIPGLRSGTSRRFIPETESGEIAGLFGQQSRAVKTAPQRTIQDIIGLFDQTTQRQNLKVVGAVRPKGSDQVFTIGEGGRPIESPEQLLEQGFREDEVQEVSVEEAKALGIQLPDVAGAARTPGEITNLFKQTPERKAKKVEGAVRIKGTDQVFTIGKGGKIIKSPEQLLTEGFREDEVEEISAEEARDLNIQIGEDKKKVVERGEKSIEEFAEEIDEGEPDESGAIGTSTSARERAKEELGIDLPEQPTVLDLFAEGDQARLTTAQEERVKLQEQTTSILNERLKIQEEFQKFEDEQVGLPEAGRVGAVAEKGKELQRRLDVLNRRELVIELKLQNRNTTISTLMSAKKQDFEASVRDYNTRFSQALQLYNAFNKKDTEIQRNSQASLDVLIDAFTGQIKGNQATFEEVIAAHGAKLEELELMAGLPEGSTRELLKSKSASKGFEYKGTIGSANTGYKALWINPKTGESKLEKLTVGTGGEDIIVKEKPVRTTFEGETITNTDIDRVEDLLRRVKSGGGNRTNAEEVLRGAGMEPDDFLKEFDTVFKGGLNFDSF